MAADKRDSEVGVTFIGVEKVEKTGTAIVEYKARTKNDIVKRSETVRLPERSVNTLKMKIGEINPSNKLFQFLSYASSCHSLAQHTGTREEINSVGGRH